MAMSGKPGLMYALLVGTALMFVYRGVLRTPWFEFGGECVVNCVKSGHSAKIVFHTKVRSCFPKVCTSCICIFRYVLKYTHTLC